MTKELDIKSLLELIKKRNASEEVKLEDKHSLEKGALKNFNDPLILHKEAAAKEYCESPLVLENLDNMKENANETLSASEEKAESRQIGEDLKTLRIPSALFKYGKRRRRKAS